MSTERVIVDQSVADEFVAKLAVRAEALTVGDPSCDNVVLGGLVSAGSAAHVRALISDAVAKGATLAAGGGGEESIVPATVVDCVSRDMRIYTEESFGPVTAIIRVADAEAAIATANDSDYGLAAAVFGRDITRALAVAHRIKSGICHINAPTVHDEPQMPFGGVGFSGHGRFGGKASIEEFTDLRWITINAGPHHYPF